MSAVTGNMSYPGDLGNVQVYSILVISTQLSTSQDKHISSFKHISNLDDGQNFINCNTKLYTTIMSRQQLSI